MKSGGSRIVETVAAVAIKADSFIDYKLELSEFKWKPTVSTVLETKLQILFFWNKEGSNLLI
jgi:hypothetical protein